MAPATSKLVNNEKGFLLVLVAIAMAFLIAISALAVDVGYMYVVKRQLQTAAEACALAGAGDLLQQGSPIIQWTLAQQKASSFVQKNQAAGVDLVDAQATAGYWNINQNPNNIQSQAMIPTVNDIPAVEVNVSKSPGNNGGPLRLFFAGVIGYPSASLTAKAVSAVATAGTMTGGVFPIAIKKSFVDGYPIQSNGQSVPFTLNPDMEDTSWWTTLKEPQVPGANHVADLINTTHPLKNPISVGDTIQNASGQKAVLYDVIDSLKGKVMYVPVVDDINSDKIVGFASFYIVSGDKKNKVVNGYLMNSTTPFAGIGPGGVDYGAHAIALVN